MPMWEDIFNEIRRLERRMEKLLEEFTERPIRMPFREEFRTPEADIIETDKEIKVVVDLPGVRKEDIKINATEDEVEIRAERKREEKEEREGFIRREREFGRFYRRFTLPTKVDPNGAKATYKNGVLEIILPKVEAKERTEIKIE